LRKMLDDREVGRLFESVTTVPAEYLFQLFGADARRRRQTQLTVLQPGEGWYEEDKPHRHALKCLFEKAHCRHPRHDSRPVEGIGRGGHAVTQKGLNEFGNAKIAVILVQVAFNQAGGDEAARRVDYARVWSLGVRDVSDRSDAPALDRHVGRVDFGGRDVDEAATLNDGVGWRFSHCHIDEFSSLYRLGRISKTRPGSVFIVLG